MDVQARKLEKRTHLRSGLQGQQTGDVRNVRLNLGVIIIVHFVHKA